MADKARAQAPKPQHSAPKTPAQAISTQALRLALVLHVMLLRRNHVLTVTRLLTMYPLHCNPFVLFRIIDANIDCKNAELDSGQAGIRAILTHHDHHGGLPASDPFDFPVDRLLAQSTHRAKVPSSATPIWICEWFQPHGSPDSGC
ncbi:hypothetical protein J1614_010749 [Plenodomus biglobosus]|nr:hypothetical protein J1614_010749 [Plenodomus biglobosus]